jgi:hypothetical protein
LFVSTAPPAGSERRESDLGVKRAPVRPLALLSFPPVRVMGLAALCNVHISAGQVHKNAQTQKPLPLAAPRITKEKDSHLSKIGFLPQGTPATSGDPPVGRTGRHPRAQSPRSPPVFTRLLAFSRSNCRRATRAHELPLSSLRYAFQCPTACNVCPDLSHSRARLKCASE